MRWQCALIAALMGLGCSNGDRPGGDSPKVSASVPGGGPEIEVTVHRLAPVREQNLTASPQQIRAVRSETGGAAMVLVSPKVTHHHHRRHHRSTAVAQKAPLTKPPWDDSLRHALQQKYNQGQKKPAIPPRTQPSENPPPDVTGGGN